MMKSQGLHVGLCDFFRKILEKIKSLITKDVSGEAAFWIFWGVCAFFYFAYIGTSSLVKIF